MQQFEPVRLTRRELEILTLVADGASNREVAKGLWLSDQTLKFHLANIYRKLGVSKRGDAIRRAKELGLLSDDPDHSDDADDGPDFPAGGAAVVTP